MGSPSMDRFGGASQAHLDLRRNDTFAILNFQHKTLDWNIDGTHWRAGYAEHLHQSLTDPSMCYGMSTDVIEDAVTQPGAPMLAATTDPLLKITGAAHKAGAR